MVESSTTALCPWLLYSYSNNNHNLLYSSYGNNYHNRFRNVAGSCSQSSSSIPYLKNKTILGSSHGWLILNYQTAASMYLPDPAINFYYLWNPITLQTINLPPFEPNPKHKCVVIASFILSSPPGDDDPNSMLLLFEIAIPAVFVCRLSNPEWIELTYDSLYDQSWVESSGGYKYEKGHLRSPVSYNGNVFAIGGKRELFRVEVKLDNTIFLHPLIHLPLLPASRPNSLRENLVECCGELYIVHCTLSDVHASSSHVVGVHVFKLNFSEMIWERVDNIHDHAFFLSYGIAISCSSSALSNFPALKNRIHFTMYEDNDKILYIYHVEDGTITVCAPPLELPTSRSSAIWITLPTLGTNKGEEKEVTLVFAEERKDSKENFFPWTDLPMDVQKLIMEKLLPFDYMNFRAICRMNRLVAPPIQWRTKLAGLDHQPDQLHSLSPSLIYSPAGKNVCNFLDPNLSGRYLVKTPQLFQDPIVRCCKESWLLMSEPRNSKDGLLSMFLFNPFTKATIQLQSLSLHVEGCFPARFSLLPYTSDRCYVVFFVSANEMVNFLVTYPGSEEWSHLPFFDDTQVFHPVDNAPVFLNDSLYYLGEDGKLGVLRKMEEEWSWEVFDVQERPKNFQHAYLVECDGELLSVFVGKLGKWVKVFKLRTTDDSTTINRRWEPVFNLDKHVLYLSRLSTFSKVAQVEGTKNIIYFERLYRERVIFYSLNTKKFHTSYYKDSRKSYYNTSEPLLCAWIEPNWCDKLPQRK